MNSDQVELEATARINVWRVRINYAGRDQLSREAWSRDEIGIWYGGWTAEDWTASLTAADQLTSLNASPGQKGLSWEMSRSYLLICNRFARMAEGAWVLGFHDSTIHMGRVTGPIEASIDHPFNREGE